MSPNKRNLMVGVVVLAGLGVLAWMVLKFANRAAEFFLTKGTRIQLIADRADGLSDGSAVYYRGVGVGRVLAVRLRGDGRVQIDAIIEPGQQVPSNVEGLIRTGNLLSASASIFLEPVRDASRGDPAAVAPTTEPVRLIQAGDTLRATLPRGSPIIPDEFTGLAHDIQEQKLIRHLDETVVNIREQAIKAGTLMDSVNELVSDEKMRSDLRAAMANVREATEQANRLGKQLEGLSTQTSQTIADVRTQVNRGGEHVDEIARNLNSRVDQVGKVLERFQSIASRVEKGEGTAGLLVRDPKLYDNLVNTAAELNLMVRDMRRLVQQWEQEGLSFRLGKK